MAHAMELVSECGILKSHPLLTFRSGVYSYRIERKGDQSIYTVSDGSATLSMPIQYAVGLGSAGQTYVFEKDGAYFESLVSYFRAIDGLDITLGDQGVHPADLLEAAGRRLGQRELTLCFGCHSTNAVADSRLNLDTLIPGVQCEHCHGETQHHLEGLRTGDTKLFQMKDLRNMSAEETSHFCGQCHRTWEQIAANGPHNSSNVRFQPYRLTNSRCYDPDDARMRCTACHDPHREVDRSPADYDGKCQACHDSGGKARVCQVANKKCSSCHMPKIELTGGHFQFTDHEIRIVRPGELYPN